MKKIFLLFLLSIGLFANVNNFLSLSEFLKTYQQKYNAEHKDKVYFILKNDNDIPELINVKKAKKTLNYNIDTMKYFLKQITGETINIKEINSGNKKILIVDISKKNKIQSPYLKIIRKLKQIKKEGARLEIVNPDFNAKDFQEDIDAIIQKLKEYNNLK